MDRGQTTLDFAVGIGLFMLTVAFVFAFVPGMLQPFAGGQDRPLVVDRTATQLGVNLLATPEHPYVLNATCTAGLFEQVNDGSNAPESCRFDTDADTISEVLGVGGTTTLNVTVENETGIVTHGGRELRAGPPVQSGSGSTTVAQRVVLLDGERTRLFVRAW